MIAKMQPGQAGFSEYKDSLSMEKAAGGILVMKIAASDFDGTLYVEGKGVTAMDISAIQRWRAAGNKFGLVTGRGLSFILAGIEPYDLPYDFLVCTNGAVVFDADRRLLSAWRLDHTVLDELMADPFVEDSHYVLFFRLTDALIYWRQRELHPELAAAPLQEMAMPSAQGVKDITQVSLAFASRQDAERVAGILQEKFAERLYVSTNRNYIDIIAAGVDKSVGLRALQARMQWQGLPMLVVGDDTNDLPMLQYFHGYTVKRARPAIQQQAVRVYDSVGEMLDENLSAEA